MLPAQGRATFFETVSKSATAHPAEVLREFLPGDMTVTDAARRLQVSRVQLLRLLNGRATMTAGMAIRVGMLTNTKAESWLRDQVQRDLWRAIEARRPRIHPVTAE